MVDSADQLAEQLYADVRAHGAKAIPLIAVRLRVFGFGEREKAMQAIIETLARDIPNDAARCA